MQDIFQNISILTFSLLDENEVPPLARHHGDAPLLCKLYNEGLIEARAFHQNEVFEAAKIFAKTEGFVVAPESAHGLKGAIEEAIKCKEEEEEKTICFLNSGHGYFDLAAYDLYNNNMLQDYEYPDELIKAYAEK